MKRLFFWIILVAVGGCASQSVKPEKTTVHSIDLTEALVNPEAANGKEVEWGGSIVSVTNLEKSTRLEIVDRPLDRQRRPERNDETAGRFIAIVDGFLDPEVYARGRDITFEGNITGIDSGVIGRFPYRFIVIHVKHHRLWKARKPVEVRYVPDPIDPWFFHPYYRPYPPLWW